MEKEKLSKKQIIPLVIGVLTMIIFVSSATYAYFRVSIGNTATSTTITGDIGGGTLGTITLDGGGTELYLGVSAYDMSENKKGTTYYSSTTEGSRETNLANAGKTTYTATLSGDESNSVMYACDYEFTVTASGSMLGKSYEPQLIFEGDINKTLYFSNSSNTTQKVSGTFRKITSENPTKEFNAYLQFTNTNSTQNSLAGTSLSVEIENTKWNCYLLDDSDLVGDAYAIVIPNELENDWSDEKGIDLIFLRSETPINVGDVYNEENILKVYTGFEEVEYDTEKEVPWVELGDFNGTPAMRVIFEDEIRPISTAHWFGVTVDVDYNTMDFTKLNTSLVTNMSGMFHTEFSEDIELIGLETWDTSNVTNMSGMFWFTEREESISLDLSDWDVSNVTNMSYMFGVGGNNSTIDVSGWDTSNVTNMKEMFFGYGDSYVNVIGLSGFNTSKITDMSYMFQSIRFANGTDLSGWDVSNVTNMSHMFEYSEIGDDIGDISKWDTGNVTNMSYMFVWVILPGDFALNLSGWDVRKVTNHSDFFSEMDAETWEEIPSTKITEPKWSTTS